MTREKRNLLQTLAVLLGGSLLGVVSADIAGMLPTHCGRTVTFALVASLLILWGSDAIAVSIEFARRYIRDKGLRKPLIGILTGLDGKAENSIQGAWTDIPASQWEEEIRKVSGTRHSAVRIQLIPVTRVNDSFTAIVNPFGGTYPESSFDGYPVYKKLLTFVRRGGMFVNVADLPTYFAHNPLLGRNIDRTPAAYTFSGTPLRFFNRVPLLEEIAVETWNCEGLGPPQLTCRLDSRFASCGPPKVQITATRLAIVPDHENFQPILGPETLDNKKVSPMWICKYGNGRILASLSFLADPHTANRVLVPILVNVLVQELTSGKGGKRSS